MTEYEKVVYAQSSTAEFFNITSLDMDEYFLKLVSLNIAKSNRENLAGATVNKFDNTTIIAWFNGHPFHTPPLAVNLVHNAIVKAMLGMDHSIQLYNHPVAMATSIEAERANTFGNTISWRLGLLFALASASYIMSYVKVKSQSQPTKYFQYLLKISFRQERTSKFKLLQALGGVNVFIFWSASFLWDLLTFLITILLIILTLAPFKIDYWSSPEELGLIFAVLFTFCFATLPMNYVLSLFFKSPTIGMQVMVFMNIVAGIYLYYSISCILF